MAITLPFYVAKVVSYYEGIDFFDNVCYNVNIIVLGVIHKRFAISLIVPRDVASSIRRWLRKPARRKDLVRGDPKF